MKHGLKILLWSVSGLIALLAVCVAVLLHADWNRAKPWINERVSQASGRPFAINGDLSVSWHTHGEAQHGWRQWIPWPRLHAQNIVFGNPPWAKAAANMAEVRDVDFSLDPLALLRQKIAIPALVLDGPALTLERAGDGKNNWTLQSTAPSDWQLDVKRLVLKQGVVRVVDAIKHADVKAAIDTLEGDPEHGIGWTLSGTYNGQPVSGKGKAGSVLSLRNQTAPYPLEADARIGKTMVSLKGTVTGLTDLKALDMRLKLSGVSMANLYPFTGIVLPETRPYATEGRLVGTLGARRGDWVYENFRGKMGESDLSGTLEYQSRQPRPLLKGTVTSRLLRFDDLAPLIGADSNASKAQRDAPNQPAGKVLPVEAFKSERWPSIDADVQFTGQKIVRNKALPIDKLFVKARLQDGVVSLAPLNFGVAGGNLVSTIKLDGRGKLIKAQMDATAKRLQLKQLFPTFQPMQASFGELNGTLRLTAAGNSIATLLGSSNGQVKMTIREGSISKLLLEEAGLNIGNVVLAKLFGDKQVKLHCMVSDFGVSNGVMQTRTALLDSEDATLTASGRIDLARERLDLTIKPESKGPRVISLRAPLYVTGDFKTPKIDVDKSVLALKAGSAIVLGAVAPVLTAVVPLTDAGTKKGNACDELLRQPANVPRRGKTPSKAAQP